MYATPLRSYPQKFSSLPAATITLVPSRTSPLSDITRNTLGRVLLARQCVGSAVQAKFGLSVSMIRSAGRSAVVGGDGEVQRPIAGDEWNGVSPATGAVV